MIYADGEALFNGTPSTSPYETLAIPMGRDQWRPRGSDDASMRKQAAVRRRVVALDDERKRLIVPLGGWTEAECVSAIEALTAQVDESIYERAVNNKLRIVFALNGEHIEESRFFSQVRARFPGAGPAIRRLIDRYVEVTKPNAFLFADEDDTGIFSRAVQALGVLDQSAIPTLERYGMLVDPEHEYFFAGETVPAIIAAHGWTDDIVDFVFWVLIRNYYNTLQDYGKIWREWGLRDAVLRREPRALARQSRVHVVRNHPTRRRPGAIWSARPGEAGR